MNKNTRGLSLYLFLAAMFLIMVFGLRETISSRKTLSYKEFKVLLEQDEVSGVRVTQNKEVPTGVLDVQKMDGTHETVYVSDVKDAQELLARYDVSVTVEDVMRDSVFLTTILPILLVGMLFLIFMTMMNRNAGGGSNARMMEFGRSRARRVDPDANRITFKDVAGLDEEKESLSELVEFLKDPGTFTGMGARIPKGVILVGPPGTGKTLLAKAMAGEAGTPFFSISGSDFVEMFVGVGASRVRDLFETAKKNAPCIVFIDEIDAVARKRGTGMGGGHDEREQTLNQLLVEMDGFSDNSGIIVMAATNRVDILDPAIMRPGRFDRQVAVSRPDIKGRYEILQVHARTKPLGDDVDLHDVARTTAGMTGADLENLLNEAAISAARQKKPYIESKDVEDALIKIQVGTEKKTWVMSEKEKKITAYHESGHAILFHVMPGVGPVHMVSIIPTTSGAAGFTMPSPEKDEMLVTRSEMFSQIVVALGGRAAEEMVIGDVTTGASQDIRQATGIARAMVTRFGMSDRAGLISYDTDDNEVFLGRDLAHARSYGETAASMIDEEVRRIIDEAKEKASQVLKEHEDILHRSAALLIEQEKLTQPEFEALFEN